MYHTILLTLDASPADRPIVEHIKQLAAVMKSKVVLLRVSVGPSAQLYGDDAGGQEVDQNRKYLEEVKSEFEAAGITATAELAFGGDPTREIVKWVNDRGCDLVAMGTHGHKLLADLFFGTTASRVQHNISVPVLLLRSR